MEQQQPIQPNPQSLSQNPAPQPTETKTKFPWVYFLALTLVVILIKIISPDVETGLYLIIGAGGWIPTIILLMLTKKNRTSKLALFSATTGLSVMVIMFLFLFSGNFIDKAILKIPDFGEIKFFVRLMLFAAFIWGYLIVGSYNDPQNKLTKNMRYSAVSLLVLEFLLILLIIAT